MRYGHITDGIRRRLLVLAAAVLVATGVVPAPAALAHGVIDQVPDGDDGTTPCSAASYPGSQLVAVGESRQSFVPSRGGLASVEVCIQDVVGVPGHDFTVRIYEGGTATDPGAELAAVPVDTGSALLSPSWVHVDFPLEVPTTPGARYVIGLQPHNVLGTAVTFRWRATCSNDLLTGCEGTEDRYPSGNTNNLPANADYGFRAYPLHDADLIGAVAVDQVVCPGLPMDGRATGTVTNTGATSVGPFATEWWLSQDPTLDADDLLLEGGRHEFGPLDAGASHQVPPPATLSADTPVAHGEWHLLLHVDADDTVVESDDSNNVAADATTVTACGQPEFSALTLEVAEEQVGSAFREIAAADLPLDALGAGLPQSFEEAQANLEASPYGFSPVGFSPVGFSPVGFSPVGFSPYGFSPVGFSPVGFSPVGFSPVGFSPLARLLDDLPASLVGRLLVVDVPVVAPSWEERLAGRTGDRPIQDITLQEAVTLLPELTVQEVDLRGVLRMSWLSVALANGRLDDTPLAEGKPWCQWLAEQDFDCAAEGLDPSVDSMLAAEGAGAPLRGAPVGDRPLSTTTLNPAWLVSDMPLTGSPRAHVELTRLGGLPADTALVDPDVVVDCDSFDCGRPLSEAAVAGAFRPVDVGTLLSELSPAALETATVTDLALLVADLGSLDLGDMLWTLADPHRVDPSCPTMTYSLHGANTGTAAAVAPTATITLPQGFGYVPGSASLAHDGGAATPQPEPEVTKAPDGTRTLSFALERVVGTDFDLTFLACASLYLGHHAAGTASIEGTGLEGPYAATTTSDDLVEVVERTEESGPVDTPDTGMQVGPNAVVALHLQSADDTDHLRIPMPEEPNSLTIVRVFPPPTVDVDATAHGPAISPFGFSPVGFSPVGFSPVGFSPVGFSPYGFSPYGFSADGAPVNGDDSASQPDTLDDVPTHLAPSDTTGLRAISANRGDQPETLYLRNRDGDAGVFTIGVSGYNGVRSNAPVIVTVQQIAPTPDPALATCQPAPWGLGEAPGSPPQAWSGDEPPRSLFVTNRQVSASVHGAGATDAGIAALEELAARPEVRGIVVEVDHDADVRQAYADWRNDWCSPTAANVVASRIRAQVLALRAEHPSIDTVVIAGGDEVVPDFRLVDTSLLGNEDQYTGSLLKAVGGNNALVAAYAHGTIPTADPYGTTAPAVFGQSFAFTPSAGVSRLVETPDDWIIQTEQYVASSGVLDPQDAFVSGYDGMVDGATAAASTLQAGGIPTALLTDEASPWTADQFRAGAFAATPGLAGYNAHANHWALLSADGSANPARAADEIVTTAERSSLPFGGLVFSNGCHLGTQVPDALNDSPTTDEATRLLDWDQAITGRGGIAVANSGFGIFETEIVGYGEQLQVLFAKALTTAPNASLALATAKEQYLSSLAVYDAYQYKTVHQLSMYGLGLFRAAGADAEPPASTPPADADAIDVSTGALQFATVDTDRGAVVEVVDHPTAIDATPLAINGRPIVPKLTVAVPLPEGRASAGVWITDIASRHVEGLDPVIARAGSGRGARAGEPQMRSSIFPTTPAATVDAGDTSYVTFPVGTFTSGRASDGDARGGLRLDDRIDAQLRLRDADSRGVGPHIDEVTTARSADGSLVVIDVVGDETHGTNVRAAALALDDLGQWTYRELARGTNGHWTGAVALSAGAQEVVQLLVQVANGHDVGYWLNKGEPPTMGLDLIDGVSLDLASDAGRHESGVFLGVVTATVTGTSGVVYTAFDGDHLIGQFSDGDTFTISGDGVHELWVHGSDGSIALATVVIDGTSPTIELVNPPEGAVYGVGATVILDVRCMDTGTGSTCDATVDGVPIESGTALPTDQAGVHTIVVSAVDGVGHTASLTRAYTVESRYVPSEFFSPIQPKPQLNTVSPNSSIAVKFTVTDVDGTEYTDPAIIVGRDWVPIECRTKALAGTPFPAQGTVPEYSGFFHFNVNTPTAAGCYELVVTLDDGTPVSAYFEVKASGGNKDK